MITLAVECAPLCPQCTTEAADPMFGGYCSGTCERIATGPEAPDHECYCGRALVFPGERYCSSACRRADESDRG